MTARPRLLALVLAPVLLAGCGGSGDPLRDDVAALTEAANARDADRVRRLAEDLVATVEEQAAAGDLERGRAERIAALARSVRTGADVIDADLLEQRREAEEAERQRLEAERKAAEEQARREAEERDKDAGEGKGKGKGDDDDDKDEGKDDD